MCDSRSITFFNTLTILKLKKLLLFIINNKIMELEYLTDRLIGKMVGGAITSLDGYIWSATPGFYDYEDDLPQMGLESCFEKNSYAKTYGIYFRNSLYLLTSCTENMIIAQNYEQSFVFSKCKRCIVLGYVDDQYPLDECVKAITELADMLRESNLEEYF
ncbi:hypothetical protein TRFO_02223 [Tritrichomonas foetus]|uniref:Profilin n=1 Tax=Tritrichomonas foetus TaxID=1144522 RepID=A0A1J4JC65_9EUKA|nr:hypothetical protein TRFO_02223 [Tritrichomonas foetus]|eukprot:OHS95243.1 hypothetical protein TRFO_02223 [Tritrichomonas foetus]